MGNKKRALCTGITGQDGSYLAELLLERGYEVHGIIRRSSSFNTGRIDHIFNKLKLYYGDLVDSLSIDQIIEKVRPDEIYHLGAQSHVKVSFDVPKYTLETDGAGTLHMLEAMRKHCPNSKFYNATTSELFGKAQEVPQNENTPFYPRSPYGIAKLYSYWIVKNYRESYDLFAVNGILFNHESERRGHTFVTRKITRGLATYAENRAFSHYPFYLGNINAKRDWGYAPEFVEGMWRMVQMKLPEDLVLATGETHTIKEFVEECLKHINIEWKWREDKKGREILWDTELDQLIIGIDEKYYRPSEVDLLLGDSSKAKKLIGWEPLVKFEELAKRMMLHDLKPSY